MPRLADSLAVRLALVLVAGLVLLQAAVVAAAVWPDGRPLVFRLPPPRDAAAMARALESTPAEVRPLVVDALNRGPMSVELVTGFPIEPHGAAAERAPRLARMLGRYGEALEGRPFRVQVHRSPGETGADGPRAPVRLLVGLRTGEVMIVQRAATLRQRLSDRALVFAIAALAVMLGVLLVSLRTVRPVGVLARAARGLADDVHAPDLPVLGVREVRALSAALNVLRRRVRGLLDDRTRMLAAIAHDLRTYLTRLRLRAEFIGDAEQRARAVTDLEEMGQLVDDALLFARDATRAPGGERQRLELAPELSERVARRRELGQPVTIDSAPDKPLVVVVSPVALRRMLDNLIDNAIRYGGGARLRAWPEAGGVAIAVEDDGPGAPPEALARLTRPFERLEPSRGRDTGGAGLGLAIVEALAESQGGSLTLENRAEGGLRATVRLPAA
ncbi:MAG: HAMP domain-containing protein [Alphaproteobacteria bacterium]|nr:HAMP domain-containing protein [Alphaproteobacteria bacterium]MBU1514555.1 HAMP domain-containing protein [Alphaproteobacteria bacterium]MBU2096813.1 HAMP domain-containing protein [Alphaproteobacteria bacterium]MBU2153440.1 HAMP domain-containing protein [Alphaproteobacteria bacterium]MBU2306055.1 HAMP domain-containing protein [Alphaproteobacteria bacterium]